MRNILIKILPQILSVTGVFLILLVIYSTIAACNIDYRYSDSLFMLGRLLAVSLIIQCLLAIALIRKTDIPNRSLSTLLIAFVHIFLVVFILGRFHEQTDDDALLTIVRVVILFIYYLIVIWSYSRISSGKYNLISLMISILVPALLILAASQVYFLNRLLLPTNTRGNFDLGTSQCTVDPLTGWVKCPENYQPTIKPTCFRII